MNRRRFLTGMGLVGAAAAAGGAFVPFAEAMDVPRFNFAHITDLHLDVKGDSTWQYRENSIPLFIDALRQVQRLPKLDFLVFGGDQIHYGPRDKETLDVFQKWVAHLDMPYYILLGNTEVSPVSGVSQLGRDEYLKAWAGKGLRPGRSSWISDPVKHVRIIGFDVTVDGKPHGEAGQAGLKWLEEQLAASRLKKMVIVFTHQLLLPTCDRDRSHEWSLWMVRNHEQVRSIIERHPNVRLVVSGHHHVSKVETVAGVTYVSDPAVVTYPCSFRAFSVTPSGVRLWNVGLDDEAAVKRAKELLESDPYARMYDAADPRKVSEYSGGLTEKDREAFLKL